MEPAPAQAELQPGAAPTLLDPEMATSQAATACLGQPAKACDCGQQCEGHVQSRRSGCAAQCPEACCLPSGHEDEHRCLDCWRAAYRGRKSARSQHQEVSPAHSQAVHRGQPQPPPIRRRLVRKPTEEPSTFSGSEHETRSEADYALGCLPGSASRHTPQFPA